jgi:hypothetical protein
MKTPTQRIKFILPVATMVALIGIVSVTQFRSSFTAYAQGPTTTTYSYPPSQVYPVIDTNGPAPTVLWSVSPGPGSGTLGRASGTPLTARVNPDGSLENGVDWVSSTRVSTGVYTLTFHQPFTGEPNCIATPEGGNGSPVVILNIDPVPGFQSQTSLTIRTFEAFLLDAPTNATFRVSCDPDQ